MGGFQIETVYDKEYLKDMFSQIDIDLNDEIINKFNRYADLLVDWNEKINLTAITEINDIWVKHFLDSCMISKYIDNDSSLIDVGTGAGFPGIPLIIINDTLKVTLLDSLNKRINFLNAICNELQLSNIKTIHSRAEDAGRDVEHREKYDIATARAVANLATLAEFCLPFVKVNGLFVCMKAGNCEVEIEESKNAIRLLGGKIENVVKSNLPNTDIERKIILIRKIKETPREYPRKAGTPSKKPIL